MERIELEVGMPLNKNLIDYHNMLIEHGLFMSFACITHDLYYTNKPFKSFEGLTEREMKNACIRLRNLEGVIGVNIDQKSDIKKIKKQEKELIANGYKKIFDTIKIDFHYRTKEMDEINNYIQLQDIKDIGLLVYYCNPKIFNLPLKKQRKLLLKELNSYGFNFKETDLGIDKLRSLYYGKLMYSENQDA